MPIGLSGEQNFWRLAGIGRISFIRRRILCFRVLACAANLTFLLPRSACIFSNVSRMVVNTRIASSKVPFLTYQKPIALFRRFVFSMWNSLIFIAITLIVSVTAPRRVPRTGRMSLLIPLDSPLSQVSFGVLPSLSESERVAPFLQGPCLASLWCLPFLFCDIIISSTLHNVKCYFMFFHGDIQQRNLVQFSALSPFQAQADLL